MWGGLRGAVGLALGLLVFTDSSICLFIRTRVLFHTAGMVVLTVVINGTSMRYLIGCLQMATVPRSKALVFAQALRRIEAAADEREKVAMKEVRSACTRTCHMPPMGMHMPHATCTCHMHRHMHIPHAHSTGTCTCTCT